MVRKRKKLREDRDFGTPEIQIKRSKISPKDPSQSSCPLDALHSRGIISVIEHAAGVDFRSVRALIFGTSQHPKAINLNRVSGSEVFKDHELAEKRYREACSALKREGSRVFELVEDIIVAEKWPFWFGLSRFDTDQKLTLRGFRVLAHWHGGK